MLHLGSFPVQPHLVHGQAVLLSLRVLDPFDNVGFMGLQCLQNLVGSCERIRGACLCG